MLFFAVAVLAIGVNAQGEKKAETKPAAKKEAAKPAEKKAEAKPAAKKEEKKADKK